MAPPGKKKKKKKSKEPAQPAWDLELDEAELEHWKQLLTQPQKIFLVQCTPTIPARAHAARPANASSIMVRGPSLWARVARTACQVRSSPREWVGGFNIRGACAPRP